MRPNGIIAMLVLFVSIATIAAPSIAQENKILSEFVVEDSTFEDVQYDLEDAIVSQGLKVDHVSKVSNMLQRTAGVVAGSRQIYNKGSQFQLCSARLSRAAMQADPANIAFCPYMIYIYELIDKPGQIHIGFRRLDEVGSDDSKKALADVNNLLMNLIREASGN